MLLKKPFFGRVFGRLPGKILHTFQPAYVFRGLNKGLNCVCVVKFWRPGQITFSALASACARLRVQGCPPLTTHGLLRTCNTTQAPAYAFRSPDVALATSPQEHPYDSKNPPLRALPVGPGDGILYQRLC